MSIMEKVALLNPDQRQTLEEVAEMVLKGETIKVITDEEPNQNILDKM